MQRRILSFSIIAFLFISFINWSCSKLDTTDLGSDLLPAVDNVHTFADTFAVVSTQGVSNPDSITIDRKDDFVFGINNDPMFGPTTASCYFQLKPTFFPYYLGARDDTLRGYGAGLDSVVLCLKYKGSYGDTLSPIQVQVNEVVDNTFRDSTYATRTTTYRPNIGQILGSTSVDVRRLGDTVHYTNGVNYSVNTIRVKLSPSTWATNLYNSDTLFLSPYLHAFKSDSLYRRFFNGLAVSASSGNQLVYVNLADTSTKLEFHFRRRNAGRVDTLVESLTLNSDYYGSLTNFSSSVANYVQRNRPALPNGRQEIYLQTNPGTYASLSIVGLSTLPNCIVHRAELVVKQIPDVPFNIFNPPGFLYLDLLDSGYTDRYKPIYHDLNPNTAYDPDYLNPLSVPFYPSVSVGIDYLYFGGLRKDMVDPYGNAISYYNFNVSKYVQDIVTMHRHSYDMRLSSPYKFRYSQYSPSYLTYHNSIAYGRIKVGGGSNPNTNYRMIMRVIYSKL